MASNEYRLEKGTQADSIWARNHNLKCLGVLTATLWYKDERVGVVQWCLKGDVLEIKCLHVYPERNRHGTAFVKKIEELARSWGCKEIIAWNVDLQSEGFWEKMGFSPCEPEPNGIPRYKKEI